MTPEERRRFDLIRREAIRNGRDLVTALDEAGALFTEGRMLVAYRDFRGSLADDIENMVIGPVITGMGGQSSSALDAQRAIVELLRGKGKTR